jgi:hypothetical protein
MEDNLKKNENGGRPQFLFNKNDNLKTGKTTSKKNGRRPPKKIEDDLNGIDEVSIFCISTKV